MSNAIKELHDYLAKSPSVVYPQDVLEYLPAVESENEKLRELCRRFSEYTSHDRCEGCVVKCRCNDGEIDECWQMGEIRKLARELGIEVDG